MELNPTTSFPVIFFDGELETDSGIIRVHPSLDFKTFMTLISQKVGISPHRISTSLVHARRKNAASSPEIRCKMPIDESSDFAEIAKETDCFVLAIRKRSRMTRWSTIAVAPEAIVPEKTILMKRFSTNGLSSVGVPGSVGLRLGNYERKLLDKRRQRERYLMCQECVAAEEKGRSADFHSCVYDSEIVGFRSAAGPVQRPSNKKSGSGA